MAIITIPCLACRAGTSAEEDASSLTCATCGIALPPPGEAAWWMTRTGSDQYGPYTIAQLGAYIGERRILPSDGVWHNGATVRLNVGQLPAFGAVAATPAPAPAPAPVAPAPAPAAPAPAPVTAAAVAAAPAPGPAPVQAAPVYAAAAPAQPAAYYPAPQGGGKAGLHLKRAFNWDLRSLPVEPDEEAKLIANGVDEADARRYLVWRRSVLLVVAIPFMLSAILAAIDTFSTDMSALSAVGILLEVLRIVALVALPLTAWLAARAWDQHRRSRAILIRGWLFGFLTPLALALIPYSWRIDLSGAGPNADRSVLNMINAAVSYAGALSVYLTLMPSVLSLIPGVLRGCLRIKALIPESILPGLFLVAATPLYILLFLVIFTTVNQAIANPLLIVGILALLSAPMLYLFNARTFTRPLRSEEEVAKIGTIQKTVFTIVGIGLVLVLIAAFTSSIWIPGQGGGFRQTLVLGFDSSDSLMQPWNLSVIQFPIEYVVRSLFTTVLVADLFMLMNLQLWQHTKEFQASPESASYDRLMSEIEEAGGNQQPASQPTA